MCWRVAPGTPRARELYSNLSELIGLLEFAGDRDELSARLASTWLEDESKDSTITSDPTWSVFGGRSSLASDLEKRWQGRGFEPLRIVTGSVARTRFVAWFIEPSAWPWHCASSRRLQGRRCQIGQ